MVRKNLEQVEKFSQRDRWNSLSESDTEAIAESLAHLPNGLSQEDELGEVTEVVETIIDYLTQNGVMNPGLLYEPPFTDIHDAGLDGMFGEDDANFLVKKVRSFSETVA